MTQTHTQTERDRQTDTQRGWWQMLRLVIKSRCGAACKLRCHRNTLGNNASRRSCGRAGNRQLSRLVANLVALARNREIADSGGAYAHSVFGLPSRFCEIFLRFTGWLGSRVVSVLHGLRRRKAWVQIATATLSGNSLRQTVHTHRASVH